MKNDTQTHAANPADNARHVPEFEIINLSSGKRVVALTRSRIHQCYVTRPSLPDHIVDFVASAPRLKRERDEALAVNAELVAVVNLHLTFLASMGKGWLGRTCADIGALNEAYCKGDKALHKSAALIARIKKGGAS